MEENIKLLNYLIANEIKSVGDKRNLCKENKLLILQLQNKLVALEKDILDHKRSIKKYRDHMESMSQCTHTRTKLMSVQ